MAYKALEAFVKRTILNASYMRDAWNSENSGAGSRYDEALYGACGESVDGEAWSLHVTLLWPLRRLLTR